MKVNLTALALKKSLSRLDKNDLFASLKMVPLQEFQAVEKLPSFAGELLPSQSLDDLLQKIDPSHFEESLNEYCPNDQKFFLSALPIKSQKTLAKKLQSNFQPCKLNQDVRLASLKMLFEKSFDTDLPIPISFLPVEPLSKLALLDRQTLCRLCQFLGLFDVASETKKIIDSKTLKEIESAFEGDELLFLAKIQTLKPLVQFKEIGLKNYNGDRPLLREIIFKRGMNRLAKALSSHSAPLIWHITHTFNKQESDQLNKLLGSALDPHIQKPLIDQVIYTWEKQCTVLP